MTTAAIEELRQLVVEMTTALTSVALYAAEIQGRLAAADGGGVASRNGHVPPPHIDRAMFCVHWEDRVCFLGDTITFRLLDCLARRPDRFIPHRNLLLDAWEGSVVDVRTIRSVVRHLRHKLRQAKMDNLASAIVGAGKAYALRLRVVH